MIDEEKLYICHECVGDEVLKKEIRAKSKRKRCSYCKKNLKAIPLEYLADNIHSVIEEHFYLTSDEPTPFESALLSDSESSYTWSRAGEPVNDVIQNIAGVEETVANDIQEYLSVSCGGDPSDPYENPYGKEAHYKESPPDKYAIQESWDFFCKEITFRSRFFSRFTEELLGNLFSNLKLLKTYDGKPVIRVAGPNTENPDIFRARVCQSNDILDRILKNPVNDLGAPLPKFSKNGRMNAAGISVFYGTTDIETCVAEVRPPIGSHVVVGRFQIIRDIRLLDLNRLSEIFVEGSYFDSGFKRRKVQASFLEHFVAELTKPVMPGEETFGYLPTQFVAEYLAEKVEPHLDGIIIDSSQAKEHGQNIILFHDSCRAKPYNLPTGVIIDINYGWGSPEDEDYDDSITVFEKILKNPKVAHPKNKEGDEISVSDVQENLSDDLPDNRKFTLCLDVEKDIDIKKVEGVKYDTNKRHISRIRTEKN